MSSSLFCLDTSLLELQPTKGMDTWIRKPLKMLSRSPSYGSKLSLSDFTDQVCIVLAFWSLIDGVTKR